MPPWAFALIATLGGESQSSSTATAAARAELVFDGIPPLDAKWRDRVERYRSFRRTTLVGWRPTGGLFVRRRAEGRAQLFSVETPLGAPQRALRTPERLEGVDISRSGALSWLMDSAGTELSGLYFRDVGQETVRLTGPATKARRARWSNDGRRLAFASNFRNGRDFDLWVIDPRRPESLRLVLETEGSWTVLDWSPDDKRLLAREYLSATESVVWVLDLDGERLTDLRPLDEARPASFGAAVFSADGRRVFYVSDAGGELKTLRARDLETREDRALTEYLPWDLTGLVASPDRRRLALTVNENGASQLRVYDVALDEFLELPELPLGRVRSVEFSPDGAKLAYDFTGPGVPGDVYVLDLEADAIVRWTATATGALDPSSFHVPEAFEYPSFDERLIPARVTRPRGEGPFPALIVVHGGPESQSLVGFHAFRELVVSQLGVAVVVPNIRGSTGYGRSYTELDNGLRRLDALEDIGALLDWIATDPGLDARRVIIAGASYGGFVALASGIRYAERLRGVVDVVGISHFTSFLESTKDYRRDLRRREYGDERDPAVRAFLEKISPLERAGELKGPLLVVQGANDPRVPISQATQIVNRVRAGGGEVWYLLGLNEGHGFKRRRNRSAYLTTLLMFLERALAPDEATSP